MADEVADTQGNTEANVATEAPQEQAQETTPEQTQPEQAESKQVESESAAPEKKSLLEQAQEADAPEGEKEDAKEVDAEAKAEEYTDFTLPEGMAADDAALAEFLPVAKELGLSQEGAQKLVDVIANREQRNAEAAEAAKNEQIDGWEQEIKSNPNWKTDVLLADKAIQAIGNEEFTALLEDSIGSYPPVKAAMAQVGKWLSESNFVESNGGESISKTPAQIMYPNMQTRS